MTTTSLARARVLRMTYQASTALAALLMLAIGSADLFRVPAVVAGVTHLGYPAYFASILGAWKIAGALAILVPGFPRLKEWAYAGMFFTLTGAAISHASAGDPVAHGIVPLGVLVLVLVSWALKPQVGGGAFAPAGDRFATAA